jgi:psp operon transcriptional activator
VKPVLVIGERGTGKELIAARLHYLSPRWGQPLIKVNCAALPETLLESELFGHQAGAFTGATRTHIGRFEQANGGTLVLDELGTIPPRMQEKILRVIEYGEFQRVGGSDTIRTDVRIVGATNEYLPRLAELGRFRADLLDRLAFDVIHVPPLRARPEDINTLAYHFAVNVTKELRRPFFPGSRPMRRRRSWATPGPATSASSRTRSSAACIAPRRGISRSTRSYSIRSHRPSTPCRRTSPRRTATSVRNRRRSRRHPPTTVCPPTFVPR